MRLSKEQFQFKIFLFTIKHVDSISKRMFNYCLHTEFKKINVLRQISQFRTLSIWISGFFLTVIVIDQQALARRHQCRHQV